MRKKVLIARQKRLEERKKSLLERSKASEEREQAAVSAQIQRIQWKFAEVIFVDPMDCQMLK